MFIKMFIIFQNLNTLLLYKNAYHMMHNSNMKTQTHQRKNLTHLQDIFNSFLWKRQDQAV